MATPAPAPGPAPIPTIVASSTPSTPEPGWRTSEAWFTFLVSLPALILNSGLVANAPLAAKLVSMAVAVLATLGYGAGRTSLKRAHLAAFTAYAAATTPAPTSRTASLATAAAAVLLAVLVGLGSTQSAVAAPAPATQASAARVNAALVGLSCVTQDLALLKTASDDLVGADYEAKIGELVASSGNTATGCAVLQVQTVAEAGKTSGAATLTPIELRAREMIARYRWAAVASAGGAP